jgi:hypothetical protein
MSRYDDLRALAVCPDLDADVMADASAEAELDWRAKFEDAKRARRRYKKLPDEATDVIMGLERDLAERSAQLEEITLANCRCSENKAST